jgi:hypothetical protein
MISFRNHKHCYWILIIFKVQCTLNIIKIVKKKLLNIINRLLLNIINRLFKIMTLPPNIKVEHKLSKTQRPIIPRPIIPRPIGKQLIFTSSPVSIISRGKGFSKIKATDTISRLSLQSKLWNEEIKNNKINNN